MMLAAWMPLHAKELLNYPLDTINGEEVYRYQVERSIGLYRIGVNFEVTQSDIIRLNPQLRERGLHYGEMLFIPTGRPVIKETKATVVQKVVTETKVTSEVVHPMTTDTIAAGTITTDTLAADTIVADSLAADTLAAAPKKTVEIALLLPFESRQTKRSANAERMMEFYQGALLALRDAPKDSVNYRLRVYDSERSERRVSALCDSTELDSVAAVMGLVYPIQIGRMATWCRIHQKPLLLPFTDDFDLSNHPYILQFNSTDLQEADSLCAWMNTRDAHIVAIEVREADLASSMQTLRRQMTAHGIAYSALALRDLMTDSADYALDKTKENIIILHSDKYHHVRMLLPHLETLQEKGYRIRIVCQYSWLKEEINLPVVYTSIFTATADRKAYDTVWNTYFAEEHVSEAPRYDLLGYDLTQSLITWLDGQMENTGLQSDIRWQRVNHGGFQNIQVRVISAQ